MAGSGHQLAHHLLYIVVVMLEVTLTWQVDDILFGVIMGDSRTVLPYSDKVVLHLLKKCVDMAVQLFVLPRTVAPFLHIAVLSQCDIVVCLVGHGQERLVDIKKHSGLPVLHSLVLLFVLFRQFRICLPGNYIVRIVAVHILVPVVVKERYTLLMLPHTLSACLGFREECEEIGLAAFRIGVEGKDNGIERTDRKAFRVELRVQFPAGIQPMAACIHGSRQCLIEQ